MLVLFSVEVNTDGATGPLLLCEVLAEEDTKEMTVKLVEVIVALELEFAVGMAVPTLTGAELVNVETYEERLLLVEEFVASGL